VVYRALSRARELWQQGEAALALAYVLASVIGCVLAAAGTMYLLRPLA